MKKLAFLLIALLTVCLFVSCGNDTPDVPDESGDSAVEETGAETTEPESGEPKLPINPDDYYKVAVFKLPDEPFRDAIVSYMRKQASIEWVCGADFGV